MSTVRSASVIRMRRSLCRHVRGAGAKRNGRKPAPTKRDRHLQLIAERGLQGAGSGHLVTIGVPWWRPIIGRCKRVIGDALRSRTKRRQTTEVAIAVASLNRMLELGAAGEYVSPHMKVDAGR